MSAFRQAVKSKAQQDSITLVVLKRLNTLSNKIVNLENQSKYMDSTALEIFNKLVLVENKIVTLTNSYNEMAKLKSGDPISSEPQFNAEQYKQTYMKSLGYFQNQNYKSAILGFEELVKGQVQQMTWLIIVNIGWQSAIILRRILNGQLRNLKRFSLMLVLIKMMMLS